MDETAHDRILKLHGDLQKKGATIIKLRNELKLTRAEADGKGAVMLEMQQAAITEKLRGDKLEKELQELHRKLNAAKGTLELVTKMRDGYEEQWHAMKRERNKLQERLDDWQDTHKQIMEEKCAGDEMHCTCVPSLRVEIKRLTAENDELGEEIEKLNEEIAVLDDENDNLRCQIEELKD